MNKRIFIRKLALLSAAVAAAAILILLVLVPISDARFETHKDEFKTYINEFMDQNTKYLKGVALKVKSGQPDPIFINELQAEYLVEHQKADQPKRYLWMTSMTGEFVFGIPAGDFQTLNTAFDKYQEKIKADGFYRDRNEFITRLIEHTGNIDFTQFEGTEHSERRYRDDSWRFFDGDRYESLLQPPVSSFVSPVYDAAGRLVGSLHMKVDDMPNAEKYFGEHRFKGTTFNDMVRKSAVFFLVFSGIFLWFLLPTWVYVDARERDVRTPGVWAFLALTSLIFGLTIYLITRPNTLKTFTCPECKGELNGSRAYCPHCGHDLSNNYCQQCQYPINPEWKFCPDCRTEIVHKREDRAAGVTPSLPAVIGE